MIAPWEISEEKRSYILKVSKPKETTVNNQKKTVPEREEHSNKPKKRYELHIIAPPTDKNGKVTYKKITSKHHFLSKECELTMLVKNGEQAKSIPEGGSFEIDSNGNIKGALKENCNEENFSFKNIKIYPVNQQEQYVCTMDNDTTKPMEMPDFNDIEPEEKESDLVTLFKTLSNPESCAKKLTLHADGSTKCKDTPTVELIVVDPLSLEGEITLDYQPQHTVYGYKKKAWDAIANSNLKIIGKIQLKKGDATIEYATGYSSGLNSEGNNTYTKVRRKKAKALFGGIHKPINDFYKLFSSNPHASSKGAWSFSPGTTQLYLKGAGLTIVENPKDYNLDWEGKLDLGIVLFKGMHGKLDIVNAILAKGNNTISTWLEDVRERVKSGYESKYFSVSAELEIYLVLTGEVEGVCSWEKKVTQPITPTGEVKGTIGAALEAKVEGKTRIVELKLKAGAELKTTSAKDSNSPPALVANLKAKAGKDNEIDFDGDVKFTGLAIYYALYAEVEKGKDMTTEEESDASDGFPQLNNTPVKSETESSKVEATGSLTLVDEFSFSEAFFGKKKTT